MHWRSAPALDHYFCGAHHHREPLSRDAWPHPRAVEHAGPAAPPSRPSAVPAPTVPAPTVPAHSARATARPAPRPLAAAPASTRSPDGSAGLKRSSAEPWPAPRARVMREDQDILAAESTASCPCRQVGGYLDVGFFHAQATLVLRPDIGHRYFPDTAACPVLVGVRATAVDDGNSRGEPADTGDCGRHIRRHHSRARAPSSSRLQLEPARGLGAGLGRVLDRLVPRGRTSRARPGGRFALETSST